MSIVTSQVVDSIATAITGATLNGLTNGSYALGGAFNNVPALGTTTSYDLADLTLAGRKRQVGQIGGHAPRRRVRRSSR